MASLLVPPVQTALWLAGQQASVWAAGGRRTPDRLEAALGAATLATGASLGLASLVSFVRRDTTWHPWRPERASTLVTDGANAVSRNPMYLGMALGLVGTGLLSGRPWSSLAAAGLIGTLTPQVRREETALADVFGPAWTAYAGRVRRWG